jgi:hypothetical protein
MHQPDQNKPEPAPSAEQTAPAPGHEKSALTPPPLAQDPSLAAVYPLRNRIARQLWAIVYVLFYRPSPRPMHAWRQFLLELFGAKMGPK